MLIMSILVVGNTTLSFKRAKLSALVVLNTATVYYIFILPNLSSCGVYSIQHYGIKFVSVLRQFYSFLRYSVFLHQYNWPPRYNWNIVESGVKHHNHNHIYRSCSVHYYVFIISNVSTSVVSQGLVTYISPNVIIFYQ